MWSDEFMERVKIYAHAIPITQAHVQDHVKESIDAS